MSLSNVTSNVLELIKGLAPEDVLVTAHAEELRPALEDGTPVIWIFLPERVEYPTAVMMEAEFAPALIVPTSDTVEALPLLDKILAPLIDPLGVTECTFDSVQLGTSALFASAQFFFTIHERTD